jgi:hypothetical protein
MLFMGFFIQINKLRKFNFFRKELNIFCSLIVNLSKSYIPETYFIAIPKNAGALTNLNFLFDCVKLKMKRASRWPLYFWHTGAQP